MRERTNTITHGSAAILITPSGEILLQRKTDDYPSVNAGKLALFGGGSEHGETPEETLARELAEELELAVSDHHRVTTLCTLSEQIETSTRTKQTHVYVVAPVDPTTLVLHEGAGIETYGLEASLARDDLTPTARHALGAYLRERCALSHPSCADVVAQFQQQLTIPHTKNDPQFLVCPIGEIGAGKSTVLKPLAEKLNLLRSGGDDMRRLCKDHDLPYDCVHDCMLSLLWKYVADGHNIAVDGDCSSTRLQQMMRALEHTFPITVFWVHVNPPEQYILDKLQHYPHTWLFRDAEHALTSYTQRKHTREHPDIPYIYELA